MGDDWWTCADCGDPIRDDPHTDPETGGDVHERCCTWCTSGATAAAQERLIVEGARPVLDDQGVPPIPGHPGPTPDQSARAEARDRTLREAS